MSITIDATAGGATSNSYVTLAEANAFFESTSFPGVGWNDSGSTNDVKNGALVYSTMQIDQLNFIGKIIGSRIEGASDYQRLKWPRQRMSGDFNYSIAEFDDDGESFPYCYNSSGNLIVPRIIKEACYLQANFLLSTQSNVGEVSERLRMAREGVTSFSVPGLSETLGGQRSSNSHLAPELMRLLGKLIARGGVVSRA